MINRSNTLGHATHEARARGTRRRMNPLSAAIVGAFVLFGATQADAARHQTQGTIEVDNCSDGGSGSLRQAINDAPDGATVDMTQLACSVITLDSVLRVEQEDLDIVGPGASLLTIDSEQHDRGILHSGAGRLTVNGVTLANGSYRGGSDTGPSGGCIYSNGTVDLEDAVVRDCLLTSEYATSTSIDGGGCIYAYADVYATDAHVRNCTALFADDEQLNGGGILSVLGGIFLTRSTITGVRTRSGFTFGVALTESANGLTMKYSTIDDNKDIGDPALDQGSQSGGFQANGPIFIQGSTISRNSANAAAAGAAHLGSIVIENSTISNNATQTGPNGGLSISSSSEVRISNSTIAFNSGNPTVASGVLLFDASLLLESSIVANNRAGSAGRDVGGTNSSIGGSHNLIRAAAMTVPPDTMTGDPQLLPLHRNGGTTQTHALAPTSPAIDQGENPQDFNFDQRDDPYVRAFGLAADIGAFELQPDADPIFWNGFDDS